MTATSLDPLRFPLRGSRLIEASAGTGKTFTIAALYLRLVLGHGEGDAAFGRALTPPEILVVTFTDAATKELRDRIRARLAEAAQCFLADPAQVMPRPAGEDLLHDLRAEYPAHAWPACARRLQLAAEWMDEAAVSTIHGWCNRMLREHAFDSGSLFSQRLETDQDELLAEVVRDYWRTHLYPLGETAVHALLTWWSSPEALLKDVKPVLPHAGLLQEACEPIVSMAPWVQELARLKAPWAQWIGEVQLLLDDAYKRKVFNGNRLRKAWSDPCLEALRTWYDDPGLVFPALSDAAWGRLTPDGLLDACNKDKQPPQHAAFTAFRDLPGQLAQLPDVRAAVLRHAAGWIAQRFDEEQARRAQMGFNDLLTRLDAALAGPNGARLAEVIRTQFPVALIDEFQDTDAIQYRIFDAIYRVRENDERTALVLIGDPKQAIYAFRGADIYTYLAARADTAGRLYTLRRNFRSTHAMVAATNRCFSHAEEREDGAGAFLFGTKAGNPVPFLAAEAQGRKDRWEVQGAPAPALTVWRLPLPPDGKPCTKKAYFQHMADVCASEMVRLLNLGQQEKAGFVDGKGTLKPLRPADMAVLVNDRNEAHAIRTALSRRGVRSVYLSERDCVYQRPEAVELQHWLAACASPDDGRTLRAALATRTLGLDWAALDRLNHDEAAWDDRVLQFRAYRDCWRRQGVLPMLRRLLNDFGVPARLLGAGSEGERSLTDLLHLAELLQQASSVLDGEQALLRYLAQQRQDDRAANGDARQLRLESDANLVQVVTVHKSKGLEYPLVFLPFACTYRETTSDDLPLKWHDDQGRLHVDLAADGDGGNVQQADRERLGEDLRKLYVALTRARYATWIGSAPVEKLERTAFGHLLGAQLAPGLDALATGCAHIAVIDDPQPHEGVHVPLAPEGPQACARMPVRSVREHWRVASYSTLHTMERDSADTLAQDVFQETDLELAPLANAAATSTGPLHDLPAGPAMGIFLHELLEWVAQQGFGHILQSPGVLRDMVARRCVVRGWQAWIDPLCAWLLDFVKRPLPTAGTADFALVDVRCVPEMEFWIAVHDADLAKFDALVRRHTLQGATRAPLRPGQLSGMLRGFIDLVVEHDGRYYVVDYKSNRLGSDDGAYTRTAMRRAVLERRYDLQYVLYLLALHRLLRLRLPDYDYDRHVGGALHLFLRGSQAPGAGVHFERPPRELIEALDQLITRRPALEVA